MATALGDGICLHMLLFLAIPLTPVRGSLRNFNK